MTASLNDKITDLLAFLRKNPDAVVFVAADVWRLIEAILKEDGITVNTEEVVFKDCTIRLATILDEGRVVAVKPDKLFQPTMPLSPRDSYYTRPAWKVLR